MVRFDDGKMSLVHVSPKKGYSYEVHVRRPLKIDVWFTRHDRLVSRVELVVINGRIRQIKHSVFATDQNTSWGWSRVSAASSSNHDRGACDHSHSSAKTAALASGPHGNTGHTDNTGDHRSGDGSAA